MSVTTDSTPTWNVDTLLAMLTSNPDLVTIDTDNDGQILIYTGLHEVAGNLTQFEAEQVMTSINKSYVVTSIRMTDGSTRTGYALCQDHLTLRLANNTLAVKDGAYTSLFDCDDCFLAQEAKNANAFLGKK